MPTSLRRAHTAAVVLLVLCGAMLVPAAAHAAAAPRLIVGFRSDATPSAQQATLGRAGVATAKQLPQLRARVVNVRKGSTLAATRRALLQRPDVAYVEVDHVARAYDLDASARRGLAAAWRPNDTFLSSQWGLSAIGVERAWELGRGTGATIAVLDTGVDYIHPDLAGRVDLGRDFVDKDDDPMDEQGHGTHVAGIAAAGADDDYGIAGVAPGARILAVRVLDAEGAGNYSQVADGIVYAARRGAKVINLSLGGEEKSELLRHAIDYASARGAIVTCASGNEAAKQLGYPARYDSCLSVGATDENDRVAAFSNRGTGLDLVAPGTGILSSVVGGSHDVMDGTSMATPYVAGVAALLSAQGLPRRDVLATLTGTARDLGTPGVDAATGHGRVDAAAAMEAASRQPRAATNDTTAPTVSAVRVMPVRRTVKTTFKTSWKLRSRTGFTRVGTTQFAGSYSYSKTTTRGRTRRVDTYRYRGGIVYRRSVVHVKVRKRVRTVTRHVPIRVTAQDDHAVDRVAVQVDGRVVGVDWTAADGWSVRIPCRAGTVRIDAMAYDVADNEGTRSVRQRIRC